MGVVNVTPDSFYDGGRFVERTQAVERCLEMVGQGADLLDLGGESSRPDALPVSAEVELERILGVLQEVRKQVSVPISVDTNKADVADEALREGADIVNDVSAFGFDSGMPQVVRKWNAGIVLMHMRGNPRTMQQLPPSSDILREVTERLEAAVVEAGEHDIERKRIVVDPGIGFGKTPQDNCRLLNRLQLVGSLGFPILIGASRKSFLGRILDLPVQERLWGSAASAAVAIVRGAHLVRTHDVVETLQVARVTDAILEETISRDC